MQIRITQRTCNRGEIAEYDMVDFKLHVADVSEK